LLIRLDIIVVVMMMTTMGMISLFIMVFITLAFDYSIDQLEFNLK
jgi:hypothetical protein